MAALTQDRNTPRRDGADFSYPMAASQTIHAGALVMLNASGHALPGGTATGQKAVGIAREAMTSGAVAAAQAIRVWPGVYKFANSAAADAIAQADVGANVYIVDDQTVAKTDGTGTRSVAGKCLAVEADGVWVRIGL